tara:strand:- start:549 stop:1034 length:486 start_codon:yes stop_codon:yes gene_type:complete
MAKTDAQKFKLSKGPSKLVTAAKTVANYVGPGKKFQTAANLTKAVNKVIKAKLVKRNAELTKGEPARLKKYMEALRKEGILNAPKTGKAANRVTNVKNKLTGKMIKEVNKGVNPFPMRVDTRSGASNMGRTAEGSTKHLLKSVKKAKADFKNSYKVPTKKK